jgi:FkbM family methyltransferase
VKRYLAALLRGLLGRRLLWRTGRFLVNAARLDGPNRFEINGEAFVQDVCVAGAAAPLLVLDVGANIGEWSRAMVERCTRSGRALTLHAFEPSQVTFETLERNAEAWAGAASVELHRVAMSSRRGTAAFHSVGANAGRNSLHEIPGESQAEGTVELTTLDAFALEHGLERIDLVKVDTEGHDFSVIEGARGLLEEGRIRVLQFEYTWRWIYSRTYLRDVFEFLRDKPYALGKVTPRGIEYASHWQWELESYVEGNYLITAKQGAPAFPRIQPIEG